MKKFIIGIIALGLIALTGCSSTETIKNVEKEEAVKVAAVEKTDNNIVGENMIKDGNFSAPGAVWLYGAWGETNKNTGARFMAADNVMNTAITNVGEADWTVQLKTKNYLSIKAGKTYTLKFTASSTVPRQIFVYLGQFEGKWTRYSQKSAALENNAKEFTVTLTPSGDDEKAELVFAMGKIAGAETIGEHKLTLTNVSLSAN